MTVGRQQTTENRQQTTRSALLALALLLLVGAAAVSCNRNNACNNCQDIVTGIPWTTPESHTYQLRDGSDDKGRAVLSIEQQGDRLSLTQAFSDDKGNSDESNVLVDPQTLKPASATRTIIDSDVRNVVESSYEAVDSGQCSAGTIVRIKQSTYKPPNATEPDSQRSNPLCVPLHAYDNDTSLFVWRTMKFEKGYVVTYKTVLANRRDTQVVTLEVRDKVEIDVPAGHYEAWLVFIEADRRTQQAWFATTPDHLLVKYHNQSLDFLLTE